MKSEFGKHRSGLPTGAQPEIRNQEEIESTDSAKHSNLDPRNQFNPSIRIMPRLRLMGVSIGLKLEFGSLLKRLFSPKYRQEQRLKKAVAKHQQRQNQTRTRR